MTSSLVGSEMCIRDRFIVAPLRAMSVAALGPGYVLASLTALSPANLSHCLLYTSDAADDM
eukprot:6828309-Prorocentrum_lima.AAC.1